MEGVKLVSLARAAYAAFADRDVDRLAELCHPEVELFTVTAVIAGHPGPYVGRVGLAQYVSEVDEVWDDIELTPTEFLEVSNDRIMVLGRVRARRETTIVDSPNAWLWEFEGELVRRVRLYSDVQEARELMGEAD
ncbi:MAG: hypothetical protein QOG26_934 [Solirubrobacterales bacterium]|nr:hypothetical protein [Solirubrobacterales bacterium]MDX6651990.1 hypothetical protein [Solirubrobacterales bacterium]